MSLCAAKGRLEHLAMPEPLADTGTQNLTRRGFIRGSAISAAGASESDKASHGARHPGVSAMSTIVQSATRPPTVDAAPTMLNSRRGRIRTVLLATDLSPVSRSATMEAIDLCRALSARLLILNVIDARQGLSRNVLPGARAARLDQLRAERERQMVDIVEGARQDGVVTTFLVWTGEPGQSIVAAADAEGADLVVVGTRALDRAGRFLLGSVSDYVVNHSTCPVLIAR
jgi:nucleotide-binding universal stress UspA family protein